MKKFAVVLFVLSLFAVGCDKAKDSDSTDAVVLSDVDAVLDSTDDVDAELCNLCQDATPSTDVTATTATDVTVTEADAKVGE